MNHKRMTTWLLAAGVMVSLAGCGSQRDSGQTAENSQKPYQSFVSFHHLFSFSSAVLEQYLLQDQAGIFYASVAVPQHLSCIRAF